MDSKYLEKQQKPIELILFRQIASYLAIPCLIFDKNEIVTFCNKAAEEILEINFSESDEINVEDWSKIFKFQNEKDDAVSIEDVGKDIHHELQHYSQSKNNADIKTLLSNHSYKETMKSKQCYIESKDGKLKKITLFMLPILNQMDEYCGNVMFFEETLP